MKRLLLIIFSSILFGSCALKSGSGKIVSQTRDTGPFKGVTVSGGFKVEIKNGPVEKVVVEADDNLMKYIEVKVVGNVLKIRMEEINVSDAHLSVFITAPEINEITASAASEVAVKDLLKSFGSINLKASSGSDIQTAVDAPEIKADASSGAEITVSGRTKDLRAESSSGSTVAAGELLSENSYVTASSGASTRVNASVKIEASASSGGNIVYKGAATVKKTESSGGSVEMKN